jgi:hypothetical protein
MPTLKPGDWKVMSDQAYIRKDNIGTIAGINPNIDAIAPKPGTANATFAAVITGTSFTGATAVTYGGTAATGITVTGTTQINCTMPSKAAGSYPVVVTTPVGTSKQHMYPVV